MTLDASVKGHLLARLQQIYGQQADSSYSKLVAVIERYSDLPQDRGEQMWDERDVVLITYGDQVQSAGEAPLQTLRGFFTEQGLEGVINTVHLLPFCPYTSDDGFSVIDYRAIDPDLGDWDDIHALGRHADLVFDLVLNHISQQSAWFQGYLAGDEKYLDYFIETDPNVDLSRVTRPRSLPLLTPYETNRGTRHLWTTFSADQIDLNYANPDVLFDMLDVLLFYIQQGARFIRLDAIAYLWKEVGTSCIHLPQTHAIVKLMRDVVDLVAPHVVLLTETNVPHDENISYYGDGDEAHMVYQFSLPPLLADALLQGDAEPFSDWLAGLGTPPQATTCFNFTASHDGIGVRPLEGLVSDERLSKLVNQTRSRGGLIGTKRNADGTDSPYELNVTYLDLLGDLDSPDPEMHGRRFLASQAIMLALRGIPGVYFHSLVGTQNDARAARESGIPRRINRKKYQRRDLDLALSDKQSLQGRIFDDYRQMLRVRVQQPAFHPDGDQTVWSAADATLIGLLRISPDRSQKILVLANLSDSDRRVDLNSHEGTHATRELLTDRPVEHQMITLKPFQVAWLEV